MPYSIVQKTISPQRVILARRRVSRSQIADTIGSVLPLVFRYAQEHGLALDGRPITRYSEITAGLLTIEPGFRIVEPREPVAPSSDPSAVFTDTLPGGLVATTIHAGPYEGLHEAYRAIESWMQAKSMKGAGDPWEAYMTDPSDFPNPQDWRTEVFWPIRNAR